MDFESVREALAEFMDELPQGIYDELNGGVILLPDTVYRDEPELRHLCVLGRYNYQPHGLGRFITVYYGSLQEAYGRLSPEEQREKLRGVLHHELTHHIESLAGDYSLERQDELDLEDYR